MKRKEYIRGLGLGVLVTALVFTFFSPKTDSMTEEEIIKYAEQLGYVKVEKEKEESTSNSALDEIKSQVLGTGTPKPTEPNTPTPVPTEEVTSQPEKTPTLTIELTPTIEPTVTSTIKPTATPTITSAPTPTVTLVAKPITSTTKKPTKKPSNTTNVEGACYVIIESGMTATEIATLLEEEGVIESALDFINYLYKKRLTHYIVADAYEIVPNTSFEEIVELICIPIQ